MLGTVLTYYRGLYDDMISEARRTPIVTILCAFALGYFTATRPHMVGWALVAVAVVSVIGLVVTLSRQR